MGQISLSMLVEMLKGSGIRAEMAFPAEKINRITDVVAAVSLGEADGGKHRVTVLIEVFAPKEKGGTACQQKGLEICALMERNGAVCSQGRCDFLAKANVFRVPVEAVFQEDRQFTVDMGGKELRYLCQLSLEQKKASGTELDNSPWEFTVEEFFPWGKEGTLGVTEPFQLDVHYAGVLERYEDCTLTEKQRIPEATGMRQIRKGKASRRIFTSE